VSTIATDTITIYCKAKEVTDPYEAVVAEDLAISELIAGLNEEGYLPALAAGERWRVLHLRTNSDLPPSARLDQRNVKDGDQLEFMRDSHGAKA
jgi:hypothetical protein